MSEQNVSAPETKNPTVIVDPVTTDPKPVLSEKQLAKQAAAEAKKQAKLEAAEAKQKAAAAKQHAAAVKEGGKKAQDLEGLSTMGGTSFFTVTLHNTPPDLIDAALEAMNVEVDDTSGERKGGAGDLGKFVTAADVKKLAFRVHVPDPLLKKMTPKEWIEEVLQRADKSEVISFECKSENLIVGEIETDPAENLYAEKIRDELVAHSFELLRSKGLLPVEEDDDFVVDPEAAGLEDFSW